MTLTELKVTRRGFQSRKYPVPLGILAAANAAVDYYADVAADHYGATKMLADLRPSAYIGEDMADGSYTMQLNWSGRERSGFALVTCYKDGSYR